tara:strand:+ start:2495 stop:3466 length:972 start_codon:yes stop_codon:yes gene_type:complete
LKKISICVVGVGNWGLNHVKTLLELNISVGCVDTEPKNLNKAQSLFPEVSCFPSIKDSFNKDYDGYVIATPAATHSELAKLLISNKKPILVEKPLSLSVDESKEIKSYLTKHKGKLMVGHQLLFHPAIIKIKSMIEKGMIGKIQYLYSNRLNLGTVRSNENVFWSFAPHDISIFQFLSNSFPIDVFSMGGDFLQKNVHDTTLTYLKYPNGIQGHIYVSWLHPFKEHRLVIIGSKGSIHFDDATDTKKLLFYEKDDSKIENLSSLKNKVSKKIDYGRTMPLKNELKYFIEIVKGKSVEKANIDEGIDVIKILEMASKSINLKKK